MRHKIDTHINKDVRINYALLYYSIITTILILDVVKVYYIFYYKNAFQNLSIHKIILTIHTHFKKKIKTPNDCFSNLKIETTLLYILHFQNGRIKKLLRIFLSLIIGLLFMTIFLI